MSRKEFKIYWEARMRARELRLERDRSRQIKIDKKWHAILKVEAERRHVHMSHILNGLCQFYYANVETIIDEMREPAADSASRDGPEQVNLGDKDGSVDSQPSK